MAACNALTFLQRHQLSGKYVVGWGMSTGSDNVVNAFSGWQ